MELISIIIPHKNQLSSLNLLLSTIPDDRDLQVIIIDDKSDVKTKRELYRATDFRKNIEIYENQGPETNAGVARNIGLNEARGEWLIFADSDDRFTESAFTFIRDSINHTHTADVILYRCKAFKSDGEPSNRAFFYNSLLDEYPSNKNQILYKWVVPWGKLIKKDLVEKNNIKFSSCIVSNDVMFSTFLACHSKTLNVYDLPIYCCIETEGSLTSSLNESKALIRLKILTERNLFLKRNGTPIKPLNGFTYFIKSNPLRISLYKYRIYFEWLKHFYLRIRGL